MATLVLSKADIKDEFYETSLSNIELDMVKDDISKERFLLPEIFELYKKNKHK